MNNSNIRKVFDSNQSAIAFEDYDDQTLDPQILSTLTDSYLPNVLGSFNLIKPLPSDPKNIIDYDRCVRIPPQTPYFHKPELYSMFPRRSRRPRHHPPEYSSLLPLLIAAKRNNVAVDQFDIVSERNSFRKIAMNKGDYVISVMKFGSTLFLRRHDDKRGEWNNVGQQFERMCTPGYHRIGTYNQLIEGHIGNLRTIIVAETDAISIEDGKAIELKCRSNQQIKDRHDSWIETFFGGVETIFVGCRSNSEPPQLLSIEPHPASTMIGDQNKKATLAHLYRVLRFLLVNVETNGTYLFSRHYDQRIGKKGLYLYKVADQHEEELRFISQQMLDQLDFKF
ncbi:unnamed protein product [Adineta steineri]|uniref:Decapping nuclease n=1 Tax=Adineta steineri TaxID=433720 RepID=A0A816AM16_9BILA|nr:unnamed protein product [Adineta steineri]CAF1599926.1 unnamed protein product [Adineta steineri]